MTPPRAFYWLALATVAAGCTSPFIRSQSPEETKDKASSKETRLVNDVAVPFGTHLVKIEAVGLVTGLSGTGSDPEPSPHRVLLLEEMKSRNVAYPQQVLASPDTSLVLVRATLGPGVQRGDKFDIEVRLPTGSTTKSLRGGWLMEARLSEVAVLEGNLREGGLIALAQGPVMVDPRESGDDDTFTGHARVLGGGVCLKSRPLALGLRPEHQQVHISAQVGEAVNRRFATYRGGLKEGLAKPKDNKYIELAVHPRYKDNIDRYIQVIRALPLRETPAERLERIALLERQLLDPITAAMAAIRLEALGEEAAPSLVKGLASNDNEVRFYAAEALAYLDQTEAIEPLAAAARNEPAFRAFALAALGAMDEFKAREALQQMLDLPSDETRYGAFRALWSMNSLDAMVRGETLNDELSLHVLNTSGPELIHLTRSHRPEIVLFGAEQQMQTPFVIEAGPHILINGRTEGEIAISRFDTRHPERKQRRVVSTRVEDVIRAVAELGGSYPDIVQALQSAKAKQALKSKLAVDALPQGGRMYRRGLDEGAAPRAEDGKSKEKSHDLPAETADDFDALAGDEVPASIGLSSSGDEIPDNNSNVARADADEIGSIDESADDQRDDSEAENAGPIRGLFGKIGRREAE